MTGGRLAVAAALILSLRPAGEAMRPTPFSPYFSGRCGPDHVLHVSPVTWCMAMEPSPRPADELTVVSTDGTETYLVPVYLLDGDDERGEEWLDVFALAVRADFLGA